MSITPRAHSRPLSLSPSPASSRLPSANDSPASSAIAATGKRRRLAKAFARPLDKTLRESARVRVKVSMRGDEYAQLVAMQRRLAEIGARVKKSALLRAGLQHLARCDDNEFLRALARLRPID